MMDNVQGYAAAIATPRASERVVPTLSLSLRLAWRNLTRDTVRFAVTVVGVAFSVVLMTLQAALLIGFAATSSSLVDRAEADFWIAPKGTRNVDQSGDLPSRWRYQGMSLPGVAAIDKMTVKFLPWKRPDGGIEVVIAIGIDPDHPAVAPWNFTAGSVDSLKMSDGIVVDTLYAQKLGIRGVGDRVEINGHRAQVVGLTTGIRAFTQSPYIFASYNTARALAALSEDRATYLLVKASDGMDLRLLRQELVRRFPDADVWDKSSFSWQTRRYWLLSTGAGAALVIAAFLGLIVGIVIVGQTLYAATVERLQDYATLRAMGASNRYLHRIILTQAFYGAALGFGLGISISFIAMGLARGGTAAFLLPWEVVLALAVTTVAMCAAGAAISIHKILRIDPAMVFK